MTDPNNKQKKPRSKMSNFRRAFLKATLGLAVVAGSYHVAAPDSVKNDVALTLLDVFGAQSARSDDAIKMDFTLLDQSPAILGSNGNAIFENGGNHMTEWYAVLGRHEMLMAQPQNREAFEAFMAPLDTLRHASVAEKAKAVDGLVDRMITYQLDRDHYNGQRSEYWASPLETIQDRRGDCEDFAILKYFALRHLGVAADRMFVIAVGNADEYAINHAMLAVDIRENDASARDFKILNNDGSRNGLLVAQDPSKYKIYAAYSEQGIWSIPQPPKPPEPPKATPTTPPCPPCPCNPPTS